MNKNSIKEHDQFFLKISLISGLILIIFSWIFVSYETGYKFAELFNISTLSDIKNLLLKLVGENPRSSLSIKIGEWYSLRSLAYETLLMSILSISIATILALLTFILAARNIHDGSIYGYPNIKLKCLYYIVRMTFSLTRAIPELILALIIILFFNPGIIAASFALGIHNFGVLGKLFSESVENMDTQSIKSLQSAGSSKSQVMFYCVLPQLLPQFTTYFLYRWEVIIRTTVVVGLVSASGLGKEFKLSFSYFHYEDLGLLLLWYIILVVIVDLLCSSLRKLVRD
jgi:phosphonate transport system permease protein